MARRKGFRPSDFTGRPEDDLECDARMQRAELVVDRRTGQVRQAGSDSPGGKFVLDFKKRCEESLYCFLKGVLNYYFLEKSLHKPVCEWLTSIPPYRKMLLMPRNHGKSTIVPRGIPLHMMIQPAGSNIYWKGPGTDLRLVIAAETELMAIKHLRVIRGSLESNVLLRALWPHVVWDNPRKQAGKWNDNEIIIPRGTNFAEPTVWATGIGAAVTGAHPNVLIKDDLTTQEAADSAAVMQGAIEWHQDSRALFANPDTDLEFITGTYWAAYDLPNWIEKNDPTVHVNKDWRQIVKDGKVIYPLKYGFKGAVAQLQQEHGVKFPLLFMNTVIGSGLTDFALSDLRYYEIKGETITFHEDDRDLSLEEAIKGPPKVTEGCVIDQSARGRKLHEVVEEMLSGPQLPGMPLNRDTAARLRHCRGG